MVKKFILNKLTQYDLRVLEYELFNPLTCQFLVMRNILAKAQKSFIGQKYKISEIETYQDFASAIPIHNYEMLSSYYEKISNGEQNILTQGRPDFFVYSSGTTGNRKYFPITKKYLNNLNHHGRKMVLNFHKKNIDSKIISGKTLTLSGSTKLVPFANTPSGLMSAINLHASPWYLKNQKLPPLEISDLEDFSIKIDKLCDFLIKNKPDIRQMIALPTWSYLFFEKFKEKSGEKFSDFFPNFSMFLSGGVSLEPHRERLKKYCGDKLITLDNYIASEGMFATQFDPKEDLSLNCNLGTFFEFIDLNSQKRMSLEEVEINKNYELVVSTINGLWAYRVGDIIRFTSLAPYRLKVIGRTQQFINLATEKVYEHDIENIMKSLKLDFTEYTISPGNEKNEHYLCVIETDERVAENQLAIHLDESIKKINPTYMQLRNAQALKLPHVVTVPIGSFNQVMKDLNKFGGQNKIPRVTNTNEFTRLLCKK